MPNSLVDLYRQTPAGQADQRTDYAITAAWGKDFSQSSPEVLAAYPDFAKEYAEYWGDDDDHEGLIADCHIPHAGEASCSIPPNQN